MKVQLLVSEWCAPCRGAEEAWRQAAGRKDFKFEVLDVGQPEGRSVVARLAIKTVPATVIDGALRHVGVPTVAQALEFVAAAPDRTAGGASYVGITLGVTGRWAIAAAAAYLVLAGAGLAFGGGIAGDAPWRPVAVHLFGLGFIGFSVFAFAEHMLPRFVGAPIRGGWLAWSQQGLVHAGIGLLAVGFALGVTSLALLGGLLGWGGLVVFASRLAPVLAHAGR
jgi:glutaredoxin